MFRIPLLWMEGIGPACAYRSIAKPTWRKHGGTSLVLYNLRQIIPLGLLSSFRIFHVSSKFFKHSTRKKMAFVYLCTCMMRAVFVASCLVISTHALVIGASGEISQLNFTDLTFGSNVHCITDASWLVSPIEDLVVYDNACQSAMRIARQELQTFNPDTEFEFYDRTSRPVTTKPKILLPRKYSVGKQAPPSILGLLLGREKTAYESG